MSPEPTSPTVSAVVAVRNGERFLADALASILSQTHPVAELVVVDGRSTDATVAIARAHGARVVIQPGFGIPDAYNCGIDSTAGDLLAYLSHDDTWTPDKLEVQVAAFARDPALQFSHAHFVYEVEPGFSVPPQLLRRLDGPQPGPIMETLVARREVFEAVGRFDTTYSLAEDVDWLARAHDLSVRGKMHPESLLVKRLHGANASLDIATSNRALLTALRSSVQRKKAAAARQPGDET